VSEALERVHGREADTGLVARRVRVELALVWAGVAAIMLGTKIASVTLDEPVHYFTRDVPTAVGEKWYAGSISNAGGVLWFVGATACMLAWVVRGRRDLGSPLLHAAVLLTVVGADDLFLLHEGLYSKVAREQLVFALYLALFAAFTMAHRRFLRAHGVLALVPLTIAFLTISALLDKFRDQDQTIEDATKLLGITTLVVLSFHVSLSSLRTAPRLDPSPPWARPAPGDSP
jgi:hypothetical protein